MQRCEPWPDVPECYGHQDLDTCQQCDGSHTHQWVEGARVGMGIPVRCAVCGGRKCDFDECWERRHHRGPHISVVDGSITKVGG
jgi:hypothetical protein